MTNLLDSDQVRTGSLAPVPPAVRPPNGSRCHRSGVPASPDDIDGFLRLKSSIGLADSPRSARVQSQPDRRPEFPPCPRRPAPIPQPRPIPRPPPRPIPRPDPKPAGFPERPVSGARTAADEGASGPVPAPAGGCCAEATGAARKFRTASRTVPEQPSTMRTPAADRTFWALGPHVPVRTWVTPRSATRWAASTPAPPLSWRPELSSTSTSRVSGLMIKKQAQRPKRGSTTSSSDEPAALTAIFMGSCLSVVCLRRPVWPHRRRVGANAFGGNRPSRQLPVEERFENTFRLSSQKPDDLHAGCGQRLLQSGAHRAAQQHVHLGFGQFPGARKRVAAVQTQVGAVSFTAVCGGDEHHMVRHIEDGRNST